MLAPELAPLLAGIERADSLAFDWHKWGQVPYDAGFLLVRDGACSARPSPRMPPICGAGAGWRRRLVALRLRARPVARVPGAEDLVHLEDLRRGCDRAQRSPERWPWPGCWPPAWPPSRSWSCWRRSPLNIVCFGYRGADADRVNADIVADLHEAGRVAPSVTTIGGRTAIRAAIVNHRTGPEDIEALVRSVLAFGRARRALQAA